MKYALGIAAALLLVLTIVQFKLQSLAVQLHPPAPALQLNSSSKVATSIQFKVPQDSVYEVAIVLDRNLKNIVRECDFALNSWMDCPKNPSIINLDLELLENNQILKQVLVGGDNRISWWGKSLGSRLITFDAKKTSSYKIIVQTHSSLEKLKDLNPRIQVTWAHRFAKSAFVKASILSMISFALIVAALVSLLVAAIFYYKKKRIES